MANKIRAKRIKEALLHLYTYEELERELDISVSTLKRIFNGDRDVYLTELERMSSLSGFSTEYLINGVYALDDDSKEAQILNKLGRMSPAAYEHVTKTLDMTFMADQFMRIQHIKKPSIKNRDSYPYSERSDKERSYEDPDNYSESSMKSNPLLDDGEPKKYDIHSNLNPLTKERHEKEEEWLEHTYRYKGNNEHLTDEEFHEKRKKYLAEKYPHMLKQYYGDEADKHDE